MKPTYVLGLVGSLITLTLLFELLRRRRLREKYAVFWVIVATATLVIALFPGTLTAAADLVCFEVPANLLFFGASMLLLGVSIHQSYEMGRLEERTRTLAEEIGLLRLEIELEKNERVAPPPYGD
ncbi:N/A [soil metagenome]